MSNLASVQVISNILPIENADNIELAIVLGWQVIVQKKNGYKIGDRICYIQIDTVMPDLPDYDFLRSRKFRVNTIKLRGVVSQGLIVPLPPGNWKEGDDLTEIIGVIKYNKPDSDVIETPRKPKGWWDRQVYLFKYNILYKLFPFLRKKTRSKFPKNLVSITDEERIQNIPSVLRTHAGKEFVVSYKLDGASITIIHDKVFGKSRFRICSRRFELHDTKNQWYKTFIDTGFKLDVLQLVKYFNTNNIIVQGEMIGNVNGNHHNLTENEIRLFNIYVDGKRINQKQFIEVCMELDIPHCPLYKYVTLNHTLNEILKESEIKDIINPSVEAEGLVWRCVDGTLSFKVINNNYLLNE